MTTSAPFKIEETSVADLLAAYRSGATSARAVCQAHLDRIEAYDRKGPALWAIVATNPDALTDAERLDEEFAKTGELVGPLHGVPVLVKDNYDVAGLQTTGGSAALLGWVPERDATIVAKLRAAGAIILAKTTMSEWARGGLDNINSVLPGFARNPYNTAHATGGSSGGTGSGLAASFGVIGLGSDTLGSIRNPSSNNALAGLRPSWALCSRAGMVGLYDNRDTSGPMARSVTDLVAMLDVIAGPDSADPATASAEGHVPETYTAALDPDAVRGKRIGVLRQAFPPEASDPEVLVLFEKAVEDLRKLGATIVDPFVVPEFDEFPPQHHPQSEVRAAIERYLATTGPEFPKTLQEVLDSKKFHPVHEVGLIAAAESPAPNDDPIVSALEATEARMRVAYLAAMNAAEIDVVIMPVASHPPKLNGDRNATPTGATTAIASALHWPAAVVPMGTTYEDLPSGLQIVGRPWSEITLLGIAYAYEQATHHRYAPSTVPPLAAAMSNGSEAPVINDPAVMDEVMQVFQAYNAALDAGDSAALNGFFWNSPETTRFGPGENLFGFDEIATFRSTRWQGSSTPRELVQCAVTTIGRDVATTNAVFKRAGQDALNRQSQTWTRRPEGWRIAAAHVSMMPVGPS